MSLSRRLTIYAITITASLWPSLTIAQESREPTFYALQADQSSVQLLDLKSISGWDEHTTVDTIDLFRGKTKFGLRSTWRLDCPHRQMWIIKTAQLAPGYRGPTLAMHSETVSPISKSGRTMFALVCKGSGDLLASRTYYEDLATLSARFWR